MPKFFRVIKHLFRRFVLGRPHTVRIVAAGPATRSLCPWDDRAEIWSLNRFWRAEDEKTGEPWLKRWDRWFEVHQPGVHEIEQYEQDEDKLHADWLKTEHDFPIYFLQEAEKYPSGVHYPIEVIGEEFRGCLTSSIAYMVALAIYLGFDRIEFYGVEMPQGSEYFWQRPGLMRLIGRAEGEFIDVYAPPNSTLMREPMYGFDDKEIAYDNFLRRELHTAKRHGFAIDRQYKVLTGVVQGIGFVLQNIIANHKEYLEDQDFKAMLSALQSHWKGEARKFEGMANQLQMQRNQIIRELSYRDVEIGEDDMDVAGGGTNIEESIEYVSKIGEEAEDVKRS